MSLKIALPKGRLLAETAALLKKAGWGLGDYHEQARSYRLSSQRFSGLLVKVFKEKDIPIQVAVGNYDLGICGLDWVEELLVKYPSSALVRVADLGYGEGTLYAAASPATATTVEELEGREGITRIASEYPNLAESFAERRRLKRFSIYPLWGAAEAYPPEDADVVLLPGEKGLLGYGLVPLTRVVGLRALLIANRSSLRSKDMAELLASITDSLPSAVESIPAADTAGMPEVTVPAITKSTDGDVVRLALPDGHQQVHVRRILERAGVKIKDYPSATGNRRPAISLEGVAIKVIRPQDMPLQVANGNFDLAITGRDWLIEHRYQFPSSPARELLDLKYGRVRIVAVVSQAVPAEDVDGLRQLLSERKVAYRVASEYINIADWYARSNRLGRYRVIPTWGATEAFLPEDADLLIENTETGGTIARHNLKIIDTLFESTACLIGSTTGISSSLKDKRIKSITEALRRAVEAI
jgi:ATP phosphoribosyltransferase